MRLFVTGGSGFLGQALLRRLLDEGHEVVALARSEAAAARVRGCGAEVAAGDLDWPQSLDLRGFDAVVHAAAPVVLWGPAALYARGIVHATAGLYAQAAVAGVRRFVYLSSESVLQDRAPLLDIDESQPCADPPNSDYGCAKQAAEQALLRAQADTPGCRVVILRPAFIWNEATPAVQAMIDKVNRGQFAWIDRGRSAFERVHVDNVAQAVACALRAASPASVYLIADGQASTAREFLGALIAASGTPLPARSVPGWLLRPLATLIERVWRSFGWFDRPPPLTRFDVAFVSQPRRYRIDAARRDLGYAPVAYRPGTG